MRCFSATNGAASDLMRLNVINSSVMLHVRKFLTGELLRDDMEATIRWRGTEKNYPIY
jgi:hypothetical protein